MALDKKVYFLFLGCIMFVYLFGAVNSSIITFPQLLYSVISLYKIHWLLPVYAWLWAWAGEANKDLGGIKQLNEIAF